MIFRQFKPIAPVLLFSMLSAAGAEPTPNPPPVRSHGAWVQFLKALRNSDPDLPSVDPDRATRRDLAELLAGELPNRYGDFCGEGGVLLPGRKAIVELTKRGEFAAIRYVLRFGHRSGRAYAADALMYLESTGLRLTESDQRVLDELRRSSDVVDDCQGCFSSPRTVGELLDEDRIEPLEARWNRFKESSKAAGKPGHNAAKWDPNGRFEIHDDVEFEDTVATPLSFACGNTVVPVRGEILVANSVRSIHLLVASWDGLVDTGLTVGPSGTVAGEIKVSFSSRVQGTVFSPSELVIRAPGCEDRAVPIEWEVELGTIELQCEERSSNQMQTDGPSACR